MSGASKVRVAVVFGGRSAEHAISCVSAELADAAAVQRLVAGSRLLLAATSFGGVHTTVDRRAQWGGDAVPAGFVRFSCGIEDTADLVADLTSALAALG